MVPGDFQGCLSLTLCRIPAGAAGFTVDYRLFNHQHSDCSLSRGANDGWELQLEGISNIVICLSAAGLCIYFHTPFSSSLSSNLRQKMFLGYFLLVSPTDFCVLSNYSYQVKSVCPTAMTNDSFCLSVLVYTTK